MSQNSTTRKFIFTTSSQAPVYPYSQAVVVDKTMYVSGQLGITTKGELVQGMEAQTRLALDNIGHVLNAAGATFKNVVKVTVLLSDLNNFDTMNKIYGEYFTEKFPARAAYQVARLPRDDLIEIECVAIVGNIVDA